MKSEEPASRRRQIARTTSGARRLLAPDDDDCLSGAIPFAVGHEAVAQRDELRACPERRPRQRQRRAPRSRCPVLAVVAVDALRVHQVGPARAAGRDTTLMQDLERGRREYLPSGVPEPGAQVELLAVQPERLV